MRRIDIEQALARGYCTKRNSLKTLDTNLIADMTTEVLKLPAEPNLGCATTGELLAEIKARIEVDGQLDYRTINS